MKILTKVAIFSLAMLYLAGCGPKVTTMKTDQGYLALYETFSYLPNGNFEDSSSGYDDSSVGEVVINEVSKSMKELGYELDLNQPDLLVLIDTKTNTNVEREVNPVYATYPYYYDPNYRVGTYYEPYYYKGYSAFNDIIGYDVDYNQYELGTLMLSLIDRKSKELIWRGTASNFVGGERDAQAISDFVDDLFAEYPVQETGT